MRIGLPEKKPTDHESPISRPVAFFAMLARPRAQSNNPAEQQPPGDNVRKYRILSAMRLFAK